MTDSDFNSNNSNNSNSNNSNSNNSNSNNSNNSSNSNNGSGHQDHHEEYCQICHRSDRTAGPMNHLPGNMTVCNDCMHKALETFQNSGLSINDLMNMMTPDMMDQISRMTGIDFSNIDLSNLGSFGFGGFDPSMFMNFQNSQDDSGEDEDEDASDGNNGNYGNTSAPLDAAYRILSEDGSEESSGSAGAGGEDMPGGAGSGNQTSDPAKPSQGGNPAKTSDKDKDKGKGKKKPSFQMMFMNPFGGGQDNSKYQVKRKTDEEKELERRNFDIRTIPAPHQIKGQLDEYVVGQEKAKKAISVAVYNHYKRVYADPSDGIEIEKSNMLLLGPTGSGKTYLVKTLARLLDVPLAIADATSLTEAGYIGDDIESVVSKLLTAADNDVDKAERGIIFIDEIDKIAKKKNMNSRDVSGESVQQELLKMLEGAKIEVPVGSSSKNMMVPTTTVDTSNILFICGGAFPELDKIVKERLQKNHSIGFGAELYSEEELNEGRLLGKASVDDLRAFGMIPEFLGRLPVIVALEPLSEEFLARILTEPKNAIIKQYQKLFAMDEVKLEFEHEALLTIARRALDKKTGARALRAVLEEFMQDIMYEIPKDPSIGQVIITADYLEHRGGPIIKIRGTEE